MSRLNDLIRQLRQKDPALADDIEREVGALADRRSFGLNFERHTPEVVELPGRRVRRGDKVRILPPRGNPPAAANERIWRVVSVSAAVGARTAYLEALDGKDCASIATEDLVVVAEFRDPIYPGLVSTGRIERGGDKPFHTVINAENFHALQALLFTHRGKVDCIYIDPPYNTGARDWKYNNDYVESDDLYRHSKWLAFMERRLILAAELLNPSDSVLIVTIDEKEVHRLALLLEQVFPNARTQMISSVVNPKGASRADEFSRADEYIFFVMIGAAKPRSSMTNMLQDSSAKSSSEIRWGRLLRRGATGRRSARPNLFYPIFLDKRTGRFHSNGSSLSASQDRTSVAAPSGTVAMWPIAESGDELTWSLSPEKFTHAITRGLVRFGRWNPARATRTPYYVLSGTAKAIDEGRVLIVGVDGEGAAILKYADSEERRYRPLTVWNMRSHSAADFGTKTLISLLPDRRFPFPKSLYAVEDCVGFFVEEKLDATVIDFFGGSGTTAHAVMRLNQQDGGRRRAIVVSNNEVSPAEQSSLIDAGGRPGDPRWEALGISEYITKPRIVAAVTGSTPSGVSVVGDYAFGDESPISDGLEENVEFFTLTYEAPLRVASNREFARIAPLLWLRAGSCGRRIEDLSGGWDVTETYGVIIDFDQTERFLKTLVTKPKAAVVFIITDEDWLFESLCRELSENIEPVRLYESYLRNFEFESGRSGR